MVRIATPPKPAEPAWHKAFLAMLPTIQRHARIAFRHLRPEAREDRLTHRCHILEATGESYRLQDARRRRGVGRKSK